jgi:acylphosphatase
MKAVITIQGVVQGVGYRFFAVRQAQQHGINGYVCNLPNGCVQVVAEGTKGMLSDFIRQLKVGPVSAHVTGTEVQWDEQEEGFTEFEVKF